MKIVNIIIASVFAGISISIPSLWFLSFIAIAFFFYGLWFQIDNGKLAIFSGVLFGVATVSSSNWWLWDALPVDWLGITSPIIQYSVVLMSLAVVSITLSIAPAIYSFIIWKFRENIFIPVISILAWPLQEIGREWIFYFITIGKQSLPGAHFSISAIGYALTENNYLLQLADTVGIYGLDALVVLIGSVIALSIYSLLHKKNYISSVIGIIVLVLILSIPFWDKNSYESEKTMNFSLIASNVPLESKRNMAVEYKKILEEIASGDNTPDVIVFPEGNGLIEIYPDKKQREEELKNLFGDNEILIISSNPTMDKDGGSHSILYYDSTTRGNIGFYEKMFLMGQGEYAPYISTVLFKILRNEKLNNHISNLGASLGRGSELKSMEYKDVVIGGLLCSEILSPQLYRNLVIKNDSNILINLSYTSWFNESKHLYSKMKQMAKVHAVQNNVYFIQTSNGLPSFVLDSNGKVVVETNYGETKVINIDIPVKN